MYRWTRRCIGPKSIDTRLSHFLDQLQFFQFDNEIITKQMDTSSSRISFQNKLYRDSGEYCPLDDSRLSIQWRHRACHLLTVAVFFFFLPDNCPFEQRNWRSCFTMMSFIREVSPLDLFLLFPSIEINSNWSLSCKTTGRSWKRHHRLLTILKSCSKLWQSWNNCLKWVLVYT